MMDKNLVMNEIQSNLSLLNADELPETYEYLTALIASEDISATPYEIASALRSCDKSSVFPDYLIDFIRELYQEEITDGNADAMNDLGAMYYGGDHGCEQNYQKAMDYYEKAAEKGSLLAHENLGYCWYYGRSGETDYERAFRYFAYGALCGSLASMYKIGDMYRNGYYLPQNDMKACYMYLRCLSLMTDETAPDIAGSVYLRLGKAFLNGIVVEKNLKNALDCFQKAEMFLYEALVNGDRMYRKSWHEAIDGQAKARAALTEALS